ncbi:Os09g0366101, partial [Oryza sativa Japonica Group]
AAPGFAAAHDLRRQLADALDALLEDDAHAHEEVRLDVAVERPHAGVVRPEPERRPPERVHRHRVLHDWVPEVVRRRVHRRVEPAGAVAEHPEVVAVEVPRVRLAAVRRQHVGVLEHDVDDGAEPEPVRRVAGGGVGVPLHGVHVERGGAGVRLRRRALVEGAEEPALHGDEVRRVRQREGDVVERPLDLPADLVLRVEQQDGAVGGRRRGHGVRRVRDGGEALADAVGGVVPRRAGGRRRGRAGAGAVAAAAVVGEDGGAGGGGRLAADDVGGEPVVAVGVLVGGDEDGVGLAGVDVEVLHHERLHVVTVGLHHRHLVPLRN